MWGDQASPGNELSLKARQYERAWVRMGGHLKQEEYLMKFTDSKILRDMTTHSNTKHREYKRKHFPRGKGKKNVWQIPRNSG